MSSSIIPLVRNPMLPEIHAEKCVHTKIIRASCQTCAEACPVDALQLDNGQLGINSSLCDGCGICAAVCPETAIDHTHNPLSIRWRGEQLALIACDKAPAPSGSADAGIVTCVHAMSIQDLVKLMVAGHHKLLVCTDACEDCSRGNILYLDRHLNRLNSLLKLRDEPIVERINIDAAQWSNIVRASDHTNTGKTVSRRHFLRQAANEISEYHLRRFDLNSDESERTQSVGTYLVADEDKKALPYVPEINTRNCTACTTCINLCPHDALLLDKQNDGASAYVIDAVKCTDCGICVDVCEENAIHIYRNTIVSKKVVPLTICQCNVCRFSFLSTHKNAPAVCNICLQKNRQAQLFQVLD